MLSNYYTLRSIASALNGTITGWRISEVYSQQRDELIVAFENEPHRLVFSCRSDAATVYLHDRIARATRNTVDLFEDCRGCAVTAVAVEPADRILTLATDAGTTLAALLFGPRSNVLLLDGSGRVLDAFKNAKKLRKTVITLGGMERTLDIRAFQSAVRTAGSASVLSVFKKAFPFLGGTLAQESLMRAGVSPSLPSSSLDSSILARVEEGLESILNDMNTAVARVYTRTDGTPALFSLISLQQAAGLGECKFDDIHDAIRFFVGRRSAAIELDSERASVLAALRQGIEKARRTLRAITADEQAAHRADDYERFGSFLMANLPTLAKGMRSCDAQIDGQLVSIPLEASLSPVQNAQRYHEKAKHARAVRSEAAKRLRELGERITRGERLLGAAEQTSSKDQLKHFLAEKAVELDEFGIGKKSKQHEELPFRIFTVEGGFEVWAGKSSATNDLLTLRYAKPDDLWFHARGASGSHVVLKVSSGKGEPGKKAREQAAGIAAYYSKMRNARLVPVAMTQKRYVRKPRGATPGTVVIEREKVIFAEPALPSQAQY